jgi:hypothetical protein
VRFEAFLEEIAAMKGEGRTAVVNLLSRLLPRTLAEALLLTAGLDPVREVRQLTTAAWREVHAAIACRDLCLAAVAGYGKAEVTRGGVPLTELHRTTLESRHRPGVHFCGEVIHCTGRLGGFNFQWAWSSGFAAGAAAGAALG